MFSHKPETFKDAEHFATRHFNGCLVMSICDETDVSVMFPFNTSHDMQDQLLQWLCCFPNQISCLSKFAKGGVQGACQICYAGSERPEKSIHRKTKESQWPGWQLSCPSRPRISHIPDPLTSWDHDCRLTHPPTH